MSSEYQVRFLPEAIVALRETVAYITEQDGAERAAHWLDRMLESIDALETMPGTFATVQVRAGRAIRSKLVMSHRAYYTVDDRHRIVYIIDVVHTARQTKRAEIEGE